MEMKEKAKDDEIKVSQFPEIVTLCDLGYFKHCGI